MLRNRLIPRSKHDQHCPVQYDESAGGTVDQEAADLLSVSPAHYGGEAMKREPNCVGGRRACSVFSSPVRGILDAASQPEASRRHKAIDGRGFGSQSFAILPKIREWDDLLQSDHQARAIVQEIHPEVSFAALNGGRGRGLVFKKKSQEGAAIRTELLSSVFGSERVARLVQSVARREAATDDVLDALVALWSAERIAAGEGVSLPEPPVTDATGLSAAIWY